MKQYLTMPSRAAYDSSLAAQQNMKMDTLLRVKAAVSRDTQLTSFADCLIWARYITLSQSFDYKYHYGLFLFIVLILHCFQFLPRYRFLSSALFSFSRRRAFEDLFSNRIKQLLFSFPLDRLTANGTPFWYIPFYYLYPFL